ncbi:MAG: hypothetical protein LBN02_07910 [Oscillospiraceae bacterium]|nr:hypothetical protein [Oscillospiraceae bacterium]
MKIRRILAIAFLFALLLSASGCGDTGNPTVSAVPSPSPSATPIPDPTPAYELDFTEVGAYKLEDNVEYHIDFNGDGVVSTYSQKHDKDSYYVIALFNGGENLFWEHYMHSAYIVRRESGIAALIATNENLYDYPFTEIFVVENGEFVLRERFSKGITAVSHESISLGGSTYGILGNQYAYGTYGFDDDFSLIYPSGEWFDVVRRTGSTRYDEVAMKYITDIEDSEGFVYTILADLTLKRISGDDYIEDTLHVGTRIRILKFNERSDIAIIEDTSGNQWLLTFDDYGDGVEVNYISGCTYVGPY